jgi:D-3-phosphoglycerate dehydrogenase
MSPESTQRLRVLLTDEILPEGLQILRGCAALEVDLRAGIGATELKSIIGDYDAVILRGRTQVTAELLEAAGRLKVLGRAGVGVDNIDLSAASRRGIVVLNATGGNVVSVAEHTLALILALVRHIARADASLKRGAWERRRFRGIALSGKTLGLLGVGRIGSEVAKRARPFGMRVVACDPYLSPERAEQLGIELVTLASLLREADVVSVHAPLSEETRGLIGARELALMKPTAYLVNAARGGIVDEKALAEALKAGGLAGAALDVFEKEPVPADHPLLKFENVLAVPHLGAATHEAQTSVAVEICEAVRDALVSGDLRGAVNLAEIRAQATQQPHR